MIKRYSRPVMEKVWSDENKFNKWLQIEIAVCEAWADLGVIPKEELPKIRKAHFNQTRFEDILKVTHHDMTAFLNTMAESLGGESRFIHLGLTSSDIMDTALSLQLLEAADTLAKDVAEVTTVLKKGQPWENATVDNVPAGPVLEHTVLYDYLETQDQWGTKPLKLAITSPPLFLSGL